MAPDVHESSGGRQARPASGGAGPGSAAGTGAGGGGGAAPGGMDSAAGMGPPMAPPPVGGPCSDVKKAVVAPGDPSPSVYQGAWTPAPTEGCTFVDQEGRTVNLTAAQHRMLYRVNEVRALQSALDGRPRPMLEADFCLQEFSQGYAATKPGGHSKMNTSLYAMPGGGRGSGGNFIGENLGAHGGYTDDPTRAVDRLINGWWNSGGTDSGHRGNMLNPRWKKGGMGVVINGRSALSIQTFSREYANWLWGWEPCTQPPKQNDLQSTIPLPLMP